MASGEKKRGTGFGLGLVAGLALGGFLVWLVLNYYPFSTDRFLDETALPSATKTNAGQAGQKTGTTDAFLPDTSLSYLLPGDSTDTPDSLDIFSFLDTVDWGSLDSLGGYTMDSAFLADRTIRDKDTTPRAKPLIPRDVRTARGNPEVKRDELFDVRNILVNEVFTDSAGRVGLKEAPDSPYRVDFWRSPVNYRGYRKTSRNIVVYGIFLTDSVKLVRSGPNLYMDVVDRRYLITETHDFKHLVEVRGKRREP